MYQSSDFCATIPVGEMIRRFRDAEKFIGFCRQCDRYGRCWACPPYDFSTDEALGGYTAALVVGTKIVPDEAVRAAHPDPDEAQQAGRRILADVRRELDPRLLELEAAHPGSRAFFAGTCFACPEGGCTRPAGVPCAHPGQVRPSLEAFGFDIGALAGELLGIELKWSATGAMPEYFTLVSALLYGDPARTEAPEAILWQKR